MNKKNNHLYEKQSEMLQIPYREYVDLMGKVEKAQSSQQLKATVVADLKYFLGHEKEESAPDVKIKPKAAVVEPKAVVVEPEVKPEFVPAKEVKPEVVSVEISVKDSEPSKKSLPVDMSKIPPIKKDISEYFNKKDESGRLFNVFKQYYTCLNSSCGATVRVTIKDGLCSLWNYNEWAEFSFVDIFEGHLRIAVDPRYTDALKSLNFCEVPRLLSSRRNMICIQLDDLNQVALDVLTRAFDEVGVTAK